jgi:hypothetical protein
MNEERDQYWLIEPVESGGERLVSIALGTDGDRKELLDVPHRLGLVRCAGDLCLVEDQRPSQPNAWSSDDPSSLLFVDKKTRTSRPVTGPWGERPMVPYRASAPPNGAFFVVGQYLPIPGKNTNVRYEVLYLLSPKGDARGPIDLGREPIDVLHVSATKIIVRVGKPWDRKAEKKLVVVDVKTLSSSPATAADVALVKDVTSDGVDDGDDDRKEKSVLSPDKKRVATCKDEGAKLVVRDVASGKERTFDVFDEDRRVLAEACVSWASPQYLLYPGASRGFIDVETMKLFVAFAEDEPPVRLEFDRSFRFVVAPSAKEMRLGRVVVPPP